MASFDARDDATGQRAKGAAAPRIAPLIVAAGVGLALAWPAVADDFTFRRVAAPGKGFAGKRITVQITEPPPAPPKPPPDPAKDATTPPPAAPASDAFAWFWGAVSPALAGAGPGRFLDAVAAIDKAPVGGIAAPRLQTLQAIADAYGPRILAESVGKRVSPALVLAVIAIESAGNAAAVSKAGAQGLMQLMPDTATRFGVSDALDADQSIRGGVAYLDWLMGKFNGDAVLALAGYNAGEGSVRDNQGVPPYAETRGYVPKVLAAWKVARGLCATPPMLADDGCVFMVRTAQGG